MVQFPHHPISNILLERFLVIPLPDHSAHELPSHTPLHVGVTGGLELGSFNTGEDYRFRAAQ